MKKKFLDDMSMPAAPAKKSAKKAPPWLAKSGESDEADADVLEDDMSEDDAAPAESTDSEEPAASGSLADASDEDLLAEIAKRGLDSSAPDAEPEDEDEADDFV